MSARPGPYDGQSASARTAGTHPPDPPSPVPRLQFEVIGSVRGALVARVLRLGCGQTDYSAGAAQ